VGTTLALGPAVDVSVDTRKEGRVDCWFDVKQKRGNFNPLRSMKDMAQQDFIRFFDEYLPKHPELKGKIETIHNEEEFAKTVLEGGPKAGFKFTMQEVNEVMSTSNRGKRAEKKAELSDVQLDAVSGGLASAARRDTIMCCW